MNDKTYKAYYIFIVNFQFETEKLCQALWRLNNFPHNHWILKRRKE